MKYRSRAKAEGGSPANSHPLPENPKGPRRREDKERIPGGTLRRRAPGRVGRYEHHNEGKGFAAMSVYAIGMKFMKGVPQPGQRPFWRIHFHAVDAKGKSVQLIDDIDQVAHWVYIEGAGVSRLEQLATEELMEGNSGEPGG